MGAEPVWFLFRVEPQDSTRVKKAFNKAVEQSKIAQKLQDYLQSRIGASTSEYSFPEMLREFYPQAFVNISDTLDFFDWEDMHNTVDLFFPKAFEKMAERLFVGDRPIMTTPLEEATLDLISSIRLGVSQFLYAGLGWQRASRLPGYCGNIFISSEELQEILAAVEQLFEGINKEDFFARAYAVGAEDSYCNLEKVFSFPLALKKALKEGNGFLALNYSHLGSFPLLGENEYDGY